MNPTNNLISKSINDIYGAIDTEELIDHIRTFRGLHLKRHSNEQVLEQLKKIIDNTFNMAIAFKAPKTLYRARKIPANGEPFSYTNDLWCPPTEFITTPGRLNDVNEALLYTTLNPVTIPSELRLEEGDQFCLIKYRLKKEMSFSAIGLYPSEYDYFFMAPVYKDQLKYTTQQARHNFDLTTDFIRTEFTRDVGLGTEYLYKISLLLAKHFFDLRETDGYLYPSVANKWGFNVAIKPTSIEEKLSVVGLKIFRYIKDREGSTGGEFYMKSAGVWSNRFDKGRIIYSNGDPGQVTFEGFSHDPSFLQ